MTVASTDPVGLQVPLWRAVAVFRFASLAFVLALIAGNVRSYERPYAAIPVVIVLIGWTVAAVYLYARPRLRTWRLYIADLVVTLAVLLSTEWVVGEQQLEDGKPALAVAWLAGPVLAWAVAGGRRRGVIAALILGVADISMRPHLNQASLTGTILLLLAAVGVGHVARLAAVAEERMQRAVQLEAATRERERLARDIHDSVLQVLAMVRRRGADLDGEAGELARLAGEQEASLRALVASRAVDDSRDAGVLVDLRDPRRVVRLRTGHGRRARDGRQAAGHRRAGDRRRRRRGAGQRRPARRAGRAGVGARGGRGRRGDRLGARRRGRYDARAARRGREPGPAGCRAGDPWAGHRPRRHRAHPVRARSGHRAGAADP